MNERDTPPPYEMPRGALQRSGRKHSLRESLQHRHRDPVLEPLRFSLGMLFQGVTIVAVSLALAMQLHSVGLMILWSLAVLFTMVTWSPPTAGRLACRWLLWGVLLPFLFLACDNYFSPREWFFAAAPAERIADWTRFEWWFYPFWLGEMLVMIVWIFFSRPLPWLKAFATGVFIPAILVAGAPGVILGVASFMVPLALVTEGNWQSVLWLPGTIPLLTAVAYYQACVAAGKQAMAELSDIALFSGLLLGLFAGVFLPVAVSMLAHLLLAT